MATRNNPTTPSYLPPPRRAPGALPSTNPLATASLPTMGQPPRLPMPQPTPGQSNLQGANTFLSSPLGQFSQAALGSFMVGKGQDRQAQMDRELRERQLAQDARLRAAQMQMERAQAGVNRPMGEAQSFSQQQMLAAALTGGLFSGASTIRPNDPAIAGRMGYKPPPIPPELLHQMTDPTAVKAATAHSIQQREADLLGVNPNLTPTNLGALGLQGPLPTPASPANGMLAATASELGDPADPRQAAIARGQQLWMDQDRAFEAAQHAPAAPQDEQKKKGFWDRGLGKVLKNTAKYAAPVAATIATAGMAAPVMMAAGAGAGALSGALSGGGARSALLGVAMGAIPLGGAGAAKGLTGNAARTAAAKAMMKDPRFYANALGAMR